MIKNKFQKVLLAGLIAGSALVADSSGFRYNTHSLVGVEGGYSSIDYELGTSSNNVQKKLGLAHMGLKIGAESNNYRIFLSGRYFKDSSSEFDYIMTYGGEIQYKFNVSSVFNVFIGVNGGIANMKFRADGESFSRTIADPYFGGDIGTNIHFGDSTDLEIGGRVMSIQATNTQNNTSFDIGNIVTAYASLIFKWNMD